MVTVRNMYFNKTMDIDSQKWIKNLCLSNKLLCKDLIETWNFCLQISYKYPETKILLYRSIEMLEIVSAISTDVYTLCAALLFPLTNSGILNNKINLKKNSRIIYSIIHTMYKIGIIHNWKTTHIEINLFKQIERYISIYLSQNFRYVLLKLAERLIFLREVKNASELERLALAKECYNIYIPLANRLGIESLKWELEDYCFRYLNPIAYKKIAKLLHERRIDRERYIKQFIINLNKHMKEKGVKAEIYGRPKHIYSIWRKMQKKHLDFNNLFDILAIRIIAELVQDCYNALNFIHNNFQYLPSEFDDYIINPKPNGYQSIHTVIIGPDTKIIEIQIRTKGMHKAAELGLAAHWKYKESILYNKESSILSKDIYNRKTILYKMKISKKGLSNLDNFFNNFF